jgi:hypothetical protein
MSRKNLAAIAVGVIFFATCAVMTACAAPQHSRQVLRVERTKTKRGATTIHRGIPLLGTDTQPRQRRPIQKTPPARRR